MYLIIGLYVIVMFCHEARGVRNSHERLLCLR